VHILKPEVDVVIKVRLLLLTEEFEILLKSFLVLGKNLGDVWPGHVLVHHQRDLLLLCPNQFRYVELTGDLLAQLIFYFAFLLLCLR
jgi:hypothetical protein